MWSFNIIADYTSKKCIAVRNEQLITIPLLFKGFLSKSPVYNDENKWLFIQHNNYTVIQHYSTGFYIGRVNDDQHHCQLILKTEIDDKCEWNVMTVKNTRKTKTMFFIEPVKTQKNFKRHVMYMNTTEVHRDMIPKEKSMQVYKFIHGSCFVPRLSRVHSGVCVF
jgi:hypothetical protein